MEQEKKKLRMQGEEIEEWENRLKALFPRYLHNRAHELALVFAQHALPKHGPFDRTLLASLGLAPMELEMLAQGWNCNAHVDFLGEDGKKGGVCFSCFFFFLFFLGQQMPVFATLALLVLFIISFFFLSPTQLFLNEICNNKFFPTYSKRF